MRGHMVYRVITDLNVRCGYRRMNFICSAENIIICAQKVRTFFCLNFGISCYVQFIQIFADKLRNFNEMKHFMSHTYFSDYESFLRNFIKIALSENII
jgi:hypothetical protein